MDIYLECPTELLKTIWRSLHYYIYNEITLLYLGIENYDVTDQTSPVDHLVYDSVKKYRKICNILKAFMKNSQCKSHQNQLIGLVEKANCS